MRFLPVFGALVLCACSTDVFVTPDSGDAGSDAAETAPPLSYDVQCKSGLCSNQVCCMVAAWDVASCQPTSAENNPASCAHFLECDDPTDCAVNEVCCGQQGTTGTGTAYLSNAHCATSCTGGVELCTSDTQCATNNCQNFAGAPAWIKTCQ